MIPVVWDENKKSWIKAPNNSINQEYYYNYDKQIWANAVTIKDATKRAEYRNAKAGTTIDLKYVNLMLVWIPRYSYTLKQPYGYQISGASTPSINTPGAFDIKFVNTTTTEKGTGKYTETTPTGYFTPSSFCWGNSCDEESTRSGNGNIELPGIWISKFELTGTISELSSIPNVTSITNQNTSSFFNAIKTQINGSSGTTNYGLSGNYDTHMIKNTEWGAMAYLSQSKYGKYGNSNYTGVNKEIYINDYNGLQSGCSKGQPGFEANTAYYSTKCEYQYNISPEGTGASTTGTIYGIYDTSGGNWERAMGNLNGILSQSGFSSMPERKYYNLYTEAKGIKGDDTNVDGTVGFYGDYQEFVNTSDPWFGHGGDYRNGVVAGIFSFDNYVYGGADIHCGSRMVLSTW